jgi:GT2 family glycosyltransferase
MATSQTELTRPEDAQASRLPNVLAVVVTHNGREWLRDCLVGLAGQSYSLLDVLVVDDASRDHREPPSLRRVAKRHLRNRRWGYLRTPRPLGFGGAINWALGRVKTDADFLLFIHDDAALDRLSVEKMVARISGNEDIAVVGPKIVSWDDSSRLEEVGMAADRFGYPYKGLEDGEIDRGQHDSPADVFYVTSTCMLVRHPVFRQLRGFDARMRAFSEDLDLCWRARLTGHTVRVEPAAKARHAIALARGLRQSPYKQTRYFIRRNRLRAVVKNVSGLRLFALIPQFLLLSLAEMLGFIVLRQPREIINIGRALLWNLVRLPQTLAERARVQRRRRIPDRSLSTLTVRETTRMRAYASHQAQRLEEAWGRRADLVAIRTAQVRSFADRMAGWQGVVALLALLVVVLGFRHVLWSSPASVGELLPFPQRPTAMWRAWFSPWQGSGLGSDSPSPPAFALLGTLPIVLFGATGAAQKILVLGLGALAFLGAYRLVSELVDRPGRIAAGLAYAFGAVGYAGIREGGLAALVFGAAAPLVLGETLRLIGWVRPPGFARSTAVARVALGAAISAAFVPGSLVLYAITAAVLAGSRALLDRGERAVRGLLATTIGLLAGWALLLPWSATWFQDGGPFSRLLSDDSWRLFARSFEDHGMVSVLIGQTPDGPALFGIALPLFGLIAVLLGEGARRRLALALWTVVAAMGWIVGLFSSGAIRPVVASPTEAGVLSALAFAGLTGIAVGAFRLDLPRRGLGWIHALALGALSLAIFLVGAGIAPEMLRGGWEPGAESGGNDETVEQVTALLDSESRQLGQFRALWVGDAWAPATPSAARPLGDHYSTGPRGQVLTDLFVRDGDAANTALDRAVQSIEAGTTDSGGHLLAPFNVEFVVVGRGDGADEWLRQRDLGLIRTEPSYLVLRNQVEVPRAAVFLEMPGFIGDPAGVTAAATDDAVDSTATLEQESASAYESSGIEGPGVVFLAEARDPDWGATVDGQELRRTDGGWGNAWPLPSRSGDLVLRFPRTSSHIVWMVVVLLGWIVIVGASFSSRRGGLGRARP